jgi:hypothetical protein
MGRSRALLPRPRKPHSRPVVTLVPAQVGTKKGGGDARGLHGPLPVKFDDDNIIELDPPTPRPVTAGKWSRVARPPCSASRKGRSWGLDLSSGAKLDTGLSRKSRATPCGIVHSRTSSLAGYNVTLSPTRQ